MRQPRRELVWQGVVGDVTKQSGVPVMVGAFENYTEKGCDSEEMVCSKRHII